MAARGRAAAILLGIALVALTAAVFAAVRNHAFVDFDDFPYVVDNPFLRRPLGLDSIAAAFRAPMNAYWIPLTWLSLQLDYHLYGLEPAGYLLTNLALHLLATLLIFAALLRATGRPGAAAFAAAVFAVHPLHVESVAWVSERKDVLAGVFFAGALGAHLAYARRPGFPARYAAVIACGTASLLAKPSFAVLPVLLLLLDYWPLRRLRRDGETGLPELRPFAGALGEKLPLWLASLGAGLVLLHTQRAAGGMLFADRLGLAERVGTALASLGWYVEKSLWPTGLSAFYPHPGTLPPAAEMAGGALVAAAISLVALRTARERPHLLVGWLWFLVSLAPYLGVVQAGFQARADRFTYVALLGPALALGLEGERLARRLRGPARLAPALAGAACAALLALAASRQVETWRDTQTLFERSLAVTPDNAYAHLRLAAAHRRAGREREAERHYRATLQLEPRWARPHFQLAELLEGEGRLAEALDLWRAGLRAEPGNALAREREGRALARLGRYREARADLEAALPRRPGSAALHAALGYVLARLGDEAGAVAHLQRATQLGADSFAASNAAWMLATASDPQLRDPAEAIRIVRRALDAARASPEPALVDALAAAYAAAGRFADAERAAEWAARLARERGDGAMRDAVLVRLANYRAERTADAHRGRGRP